MKGFIFLLIASVIFTGSIICAAFNPGSVPAARGNPAFAGSAACASCHADIFKSSRHTAHFQTSAVPDDASIKGSFTPGKNQFVYNKWMVVELEKKKDVFLQTAYMNGIPTEQREFGIVIGSGRKGQTYLYWDKNRLFQLPVSYFTPANDWCNSPGYSDNYIRFDRPIPATCLECHATYIEAKERKDGITVFNKKTLLYGIDCERCHGPGAAHVAFHTQHPELKTASNIISTKSFSRQQRLDACAQCHSGLRKHTQPAFSFAVGQKLDDYSTPNYDIDTVGNLDVHGNQYGLLTACKCFKMAEQLDCSSCHNVHVSERQNMAAFSQRCINCHNMGGVAHDSCSYKPPAGIVLADNCVDCHMPLLPSRKIMLKLANASVAEADMVRTHFVNVYQDATKRFVEKNR
ncbi:multiheme c-type cytochrome [Chitinophaga filiformis]|uniref:Cytochrome c-552/4 domain-containing protein n=1 Tax=Chitinophaga filiformis TaxID=104663 RepID=A0ABY4HZ22_CHIFI|nr:multiheme c-type cytochrome [Chitinophaga filiformis]UPK68655.1 hypothetical protein MYF79_27220 [Chitinophaga filiformis]